MDKNYARAEHIDWLKGLGIILLIISHTGLAKSTRTDVYINAFYMPMFFLVSGYFLHVDRYSLSTFVKKKCKSLVVPYFLWGLFHFALWMAMYKFSITELAETPQTMIIGLIWNNNRHLPIAGALWFVSCLFLVSMIAFILVRVLGIKAYIVLSCIVGAIGVFYHPFIPWSGDSALAANCFFAVGFWFAVFGEKVRNWISLKSHGLRFALAIVLLSVYLVVSKINGFTNIRECNYGNWPLLYYFCALLGISACYLISQVVCERHLGKPLIWIGKNSMPFLCLNQLCIAIISRVLAESMISQILQSIATILVISAFTRIIIHFDTTKKTRVYSALFGR